jgi:hypothetical protein
MPNQKQRRKPRPRPEPPPPPAYGGSSIVDCFVREMAAILRRPRRPPSQAERHLRNAAIELLEAMRACLDEGIAWLREEKGTPELKRIRVEE